MVDGRDINNSSAKYPYENSPYDKNCIVQENKILSLNYTLQAGTYKAYANREPRFYATIGFCHSFWPGTSSSENQYKNIEVTYYSDGYASANPDHPEIIIVQAILVSNIDIWKMR